VARRFTVSGSGIPTGGAAFTVSTGTNDEILPAIATAADGRFVITWSNLGASR
jgi:hypothetical protein